MNALARFIRTHYILRRLGLYLLIFWAALTLNFVIPRLMPGNAASALMARSQGQLPPSALKAIEIAFGLETHVNPLVQYIDYIKNTLTGHFGVSFAYFPAPVITIIATMLPWTLFLIGVATIIAFILGTLLGVYSAWRRGHALADALPVGFTVISAMPYFWLGLALLYVLGFILGWFPTGHAFSDTVRFGWNPGTLGSVLYHALLPGFSIVITSMGGWVLGMRNNLISILADDYITLAEMEGLPEREIMLRYGARNAMLPVLTGFALRLGFVVSGAVVVEDVFNYPGIGYALFQAVSNSDYPLMQAIFLFIVTSVLLANLVVDVLYSRLDPRISHT
ncbi:MAG TPA: ABC transporter permease [Chloroflexota bacterium]|nr:ABC transporter permease [Chloroflexota bacterium]